MIIEGYISDIHTGHPVPGATVTVTDGNYKSTGVADVADSGGYFSINSSQVKEGNRIVVTSVGYQQTSWPLGDYNDEIDLPMERDVRELDPVIVTSGKNSKAGLIAAGLLLGALALGKKTKRKVSGIFPGGSAISETVMPVVLIGGLYIVIKYGPDILEKLGLKKSKDEQQTEDNVSDPTSFWDPSFWKKGPTGTLILTGTAVAQLITLLDWSFGPFNDNEADVINAFKTLRTQSQLSYFADQFQQKKGKRLADWLFSDSWPDDRLSLSELAEINKYFQKLPQYRP